MTRVRVKPELLRWACERAGLEAASLQDRFPKFAHWINGEAQPTFKQLERFAKATHTAIGFFFLQSPPTETIPIPDFRTHGSKSPVRASANLLDTVYLCQLRQDWYQQHAVLVGDDPLGFVGSATTSLAPVRAAALIRRSLDLDARPLSVARNADESIGVLMSRLDAIGVLVMMSGVVGNNSHRALDPDEFRGFALSHERAPLIFVNGADTKSGQIFTLAHEVAHLWLGQSGISDITPVSAPPARMEVERWCNAVAAEVLVPLDAFRKLFNASATIDAETRRLSAVFRVSTLVILRRMRDAGLLTRSQHEVAHIAEVERLRELMRRRKDSTDGGGDFYNTARYRLSPRFASAVIASTYEGRTTFTEAFRLLGCKNAKTLENLGQRLNLANPSWTEDKVA